MGRGRRPDDLIGGAHHPGHCGVISDSSARAVDPQQYERREHHRCADADQADAAQSAARPIRVAADLDGFGCASADAVVTKCYSYLSATMGSTRAALRAGRKPASAATMTIAAVDAAIVTGSTGVNPNS